MKSKKLCECCQKTLKTKEYKFTDEHVNWTRNWCNKCFIEWQRKTKDVLIDIRRVVDNINAPWWKKILNKIKGWMKK